jgi:hypothetical protein
VSISGNDLFQLHLWSKSNRSFDYSCVEIFANDVFNGVSKLEKTCHTNWNKIDVDSFWHIVNFTRKLGYILTIIDLAKNADIDFYYIMAKSDKYFSNIKLIPFLGTIPTVVVPATALLCNRKSIGTSFGSDPAGDVYISLTDFETNADTLDVDKEVDLKILSRFRVSKVVAKLVDNLLQNEEFKTGNRFEIDMNSNFVSIQYANLLDFNGSFLNDLSCFINTLNIAKLCNFF